MGLSRQDEKSISTTENHLTPVWSEDSFAPATLQVLDAASESPIVGAIVKAACLGGTPYQDSHDTTNNKGLATVMHWKGDVFIVNVQKQGYVGVSTSLRRDDAVIRLTRDPERPLVNRQADDIIAGLTFKEAKEPLQFDETPESPSEK